MNLCSGLKPLSYTEREGKMRFAQKVQQCFESWVFCLSGLDSQSGHTFLVSNLILRIKNGKISILHLEHGEK